MRQGLIGRKLGMTQVFTEDGEATPATVIKVEPSVVIQKKTVQREGYDAVQIGCGRVKQKHVTKPLQGHFQKADKGFFRILRELRGDVSGFELGQEVRVDVFKPGDYVDITGTSKGKGFAGVIKRHGFRGGRATHGSMFHRAPGSIGASAEPSRVFKGRKLPGQMGCERNTVQNMRVLVVRPEDNAILVKGSIPGGKQGVVLIRQAIKK
ncbi:MAG TPA: 50S ribosomal protein L3 [Syntrophus sp. (in: bacteria)]|jgi:large subunit ribosomal protein L3|nr:50S ribosomal protein L3 [Syntrophus sp. (in: bacteria)]